VGVVAGQVFLDLCFQEDASATVDMNLVMTAAGEFIELQGSGEEATFTESELAAMIAAGKRGLQQLFQLQQLALSMPDR
jgi:ribonuclease PH